MHLLSEFLNIFQLVINILKYTFLIEISLMNM